MDVIEKTRELGKLIQADERYAKYLEAKDKNDSDTELQELIGAFNLKRQDLNNEMSKSDKSDEKIKELDGQIKELYNSIMSNQNMLEFADAKNAMDEMLSQINMIITLCANGENPETCEATHSCGGNCGSCGGCH